MSHQHKLKLAIFDWDGTIMDSVSRIVESMQCAARRANLVVPTEQAVKDIIGLSLAPAFEQLFGKLSPAMTNTMSDYYRQEYLDENRSETPIFNGIEQVLTTLKSQGYLLAVATGKSRVGLDRLMKESGLAHFFNDTMTADEAESKPSPQMIETLLTRLGVNRGETIMVGDSILDMQMARNAQVSAIGVSYGAHTPEVLSGANPKAIVDSPMALLSYI